MAKKPPERRVIKKEIKGELVFKEINVNQIQFDFDQNEAILSNRNLDLARDLMSADFDYGEFDPIQGTYIITIEASENNVHYDKRVERWKKEQEAKKE